MSWRWFAYLVAVGLLALAVHAGYELGMRLL